MHQILCVEDAPEMRLLVETALGVFQVSFATTLAEARAAIDKNRYDLILLDIGLPDGSGLDLLATGGLDQMPVIFLTGKGDIGMKASAFSLGADDFIVKPFDPMDLRLRVETRIRKSAAARKAPRTIRCGAVTLRVEEQRLVWGQAGSADVTSIEARIFTLLAQTPQKIFSREEILDRVWGHGVSISDRVVDVHISKLRKKISGAGVAIESVTGSGYRILPGADDKAS